MSTYTTKVEPDNRPIPKPELPVLYISKDTGAILIADYVDEDDLLGTILVQGRSGFKPGYYATDWEPRDFKPFYGTLTLVQNPK